MLPEYDWASVGTQPPLMLVHKTTGAIQWNTAVQCLLGCPMFVQIFYDTDTNSIGVMRGTDYSVIFNADNDTYKILALTALEECGLVFPLADHIQNEPQHQQDSRNLVVFSLEQ